MESIMMVAVMPIRKGQMLIDLINRSLSKDHEMVAARRRDLIGLAELLERSIAFSEPSNPTAPIYGDLMNRIRKRRCPKCKYSQPFILGRPIPDCYKCGNAFVKTDAPEAPDEKVELPVTQAARVEVEKDEADDETIHYGLAPPPEDKPPNTPLEDFEHEPGSFGGELDEYSPGAQESAPLKHEITREEFINDLVERAGWKREEAEAEWDSIQNAPEEL